MNASSLSLTLLAACLAAGSGAAQSILQAQFGDDSVVTPYFGSTAIASLGDVDGDGIPDYAVGASMEAGHIGYVQVFSGGNAALITTIPGLAIDDRFGKSVAGIGDINGDLVPDLLVGAYGQNMAQIHSGADWSVLRVHVGSTWFGTWVGCFGDADGDGVDDYLVVEDTWRVHAFSGATGNALWTHAAGFWDAVRPALGTGDADGDGLADALIGAPGIFTNGDYVIALNGLTGDPILTVSGGAATVFGGGVTWLGDLNGDARDDFVVTSFLSPTSKITAYDGATATTIYTVAPDPNQGTYICSLGDQDGDGIDDFVVNHNLGAQLRSGADGALIFAFDSMPLGATVGGQWLAPAGDLDADGKQDLLHAVHGGGPGVGVFGLTSEAVLAFSTRPHPFEDLGLALGGAGGEPMLEAEGALLPGSVVRTRLSSPSLLRPVFTIVGLSEVNAPLAGGILVPFPHAVIGGHTTGLSGALDTWFPLPLAFPSGTPLVLQQWLLSDTGPFGVTASNAVRAVAP